MADKKGGDGKKPHKNKPTSKKYMHYSGKSPIRFCPRCGPGVFMADRGDRLHCGKCSYTEFVSKK